ncbi:hypothetical protein BpHYR1_032872 [Brachionus plicatilis]|uniref:Uncharacterized protein n=1 Tax=Brachionus plicatilis TaxID=10195 RepID=A0A3M7P7Z8_BRAPC|nr:hypothetical protein BpHYR1_032872 [Brachionus plicatilis]
MLKLLIVLLPIFLNIFLTSTEAILKKNDSERIQKAISSLSVKQIPEAFKNRIKNEKSNWCCQINVPIENLQQTRVISYSSVKSGTHRCGYQSCGFLGWGSCTKWCLAYWTETMYQLETYEVTHQNPCPTEHVICCADHFLIMDHCFHINEIQNNLELLTILNNQGIVLPPIGK